jgi:tetratricopeptide (TPR) repeat protein
MQKRFSEAQLLYQEAGELFADAGGERQSVAMAGILAELSWIAGDLDEAIAAFRRAIDLISSSPGETKIGLSFALCGLSAALTERGECAEALTMARAGLPTLRDAGIAWKYYDHMALRAALVGKHHEAARILGYTEKMYEARGILRAPHHSRAEQRVMSLLKERLDEKSVEKLGRAGATLDEDAIFALVLSQGLDAHPTFDEDETAQKVRQVE